MLKCHWKSYQIYFPFLVILTWFVDVQIAKEAIDGSRIIEEEDVEMRPKMMKMSA